MKTLKVKMLKSLKFNLVDNIIIKISIGEIHLSEIWSVQFTNKESVDLVGLGLPNKWPMLLYLSKKEKLKVTFSQLNI